MVFKTSHFIIVATFILAPLYSLGTAGDPKGEKAKAAQGKMDGVKKEIDGMFSSFPELKKHGEAMGKALDSCKEGVGGASKDCVEGTSGLAQALPALQGMIGAIAGAANKQDQCKGANQAQDAGKKAGDDFKNGCQNAQGNCNKACDESKKSIEKEMQACEQTVVSSFNTPDKKSKIEPAKIACKQAGQKAHESAKGDGNQSCKNFDGNIGAAMGALGELMKGMQQSGDCQKEVSDDDCTKNPDSPACQMPPLDCNKVGSMAQDELKKYKEDEIKRCVCTKTPTAPGCGAAANGATNPNTEINKGNPDVTPSTSGGIDNEGKSPFGASSDSGGGGGASGGSGGGLGRGGSGGATSSGEEPASGEKPKDVVLEEGGGAGAAMMGGGGYGTQSGSSAADEAKKINEENQIKKQIAGPMADDNWKRVNRQFRNEAPTLIIQQKKMGSL